MKARRGRPKGWQTCPRCKLRLPLKAFYRNAGHPSGRQTYCLSCTRDYQAARQKPNAEARKPKALLGKDRDRRRCLACLKWFTSEGNWNRRCPKCTTALSGVRELPERRVFI